MNNKNMADFWDDIKDPKVDLKFLNDFIRNGIGLGLACAIGVLMLESVSKQIGEYSAFVIPIITITLLSLNTIQFMFGVAKIFGASDETQSSFLRKWFFMIWGFIIGASSYIAIVMIFVGNLQIALQKFGSLINR